MPMTLAITRSVPDRFRGFLASCMLELAPGIYTAPRMTKGVRERIWRVLLDWAGELEGEAFVLLTWPDAQAPGGQAINTLGARPRNLHDHEGLYLARAELTAAEARSLTIDANPGERPPPRGRPPTTPEAEEREPWEADPLPADLLPADPGDRPARDPEPWDLDPWDPTDEADREPDDEG